MCGHETARPSKKSIELLKSREAQIKDWIIGQTAKRKQSGKNYPEQFVKARWKKMIVSYLWKPTLSRQIFLKSIAPKALFLKKSNNLKLKVIYWEFEVTWRYKCSASIPFLAIEIAESCHAWRWKKWKADFKNGLYIKNWTTWCFFLSLGVSYHYMPIYPHF